MAIFLNVFLSFCFSASKHNIILLLKYTSIELISIKLPKTQLSLCSTNYSTSCKVIGDCKKKEKISKSKTTTLTYLENWKNKQKYHGGENLYYTESFISLTISNLRITAVCCRNTKLLK